MVVQWFGGNSNLYAINVSYVVWYICASWNQLEINENGVNFLSTTSFLWWFYCDRKITNTLKANLQRNSVAATEKAIHFLRAAWQSIVRNPQKILISLTGKHLTWRFPKPKDAQFFCELAVKIIPSEISFWRETQRQKEFLCRAILDGICLLVARQDLFPFFQLPWRFLSTQG